MVLSFLFLRPYAVLCCRTRSPWTRFARNSFRRTGTAAMGALSPAHFLWHSHKPYKAFLAKRPVISWTAPRRIRTRVICDLFGFEVGWLGVNSTAWREVHSFKQTRAELAPSVCRGFSVSKCQGSSPGCRCSPLPFRAGSLEKKPHRDSTIAVKGAHAGIVLSDTVLIAASG